MSAFKFACEIRCLLRYLLSPFSAGDDVTQGWKNPGYGIFFSFCLGGGCWLEGTDERCSEEWVIGWVLGYESRDGEMRLLLLNYLSSSFFLSFFASMIGLAVIQWNADVYEIVYIVSSEIYILTGVFWEFPSFV